MSKSKIEDVDLSLLEPLKLLEKCDGYYRRTNGGPIVGYAATHDDSGVEKQYVGEVYVNFAKAEEYPALVQHFAIALFGKAYDQLHSAGERANLTNAAGFCGAPEGGKTLAAMLALHAHSIGCHCDRYIYPEKKTVSKATDASRDKSELAFGRHEPSSGEGWWIVEDICNNFSTTSQLVKLIESYGAHVAGILCFLNRSLTVDTDFSFQGNPPLPVISLVRLPIPQYRQDDPKVAKDIAVGNVVWSPKKDWARLNQHT